MSPELSRRLGDALGLRYTTLPEQQSIREAAANSETWDDLPEDMRSLVEEIEARPDPWESVVAV